MLVRLLLDSEGKVQKTYQYDAFGNYEVKEDKIQNRFGFAGEVYDPQVGLYYLRARFYNPQVGLYYLRARFYNPVIGRFIQEDTYYGDGLNLYAYCHNNPVGYVDPSGHAGEPCDNMARSIKALEDKGLSPEQAEAEYKRIREKCKDPSVARAIITGDTTGVQDSDILRANMKLDGQTTPPYPNAAHHIVAANASTADYAKGILEQYGIGINDAENGVFLPYAMNEYVGNEMMHVGSHKNTYYNYVNDYIQSGIENIVTSGREVTRNDIVGMLDDIRQGLLNGKVKLN